MISKSIISFPNIYSQLPTRQFYLVSRYLKRCTSSSFLSSVSFEVDGATILSVSQFEMWNYPGLSPLHYFLHPVNHQIVLTSTSLIFLKFFIFPLPLPTIILFWQDYFNSLLTFLSLFFFSLKSICHVIAKMQKGPI